MNDDFTVYAVCRKPGCAYIWLQPWEGEACPDCGEAYKPMTPNEAAERRASGSMRLRYTFTLDPLRTPTVQQNFYASASGGNISGNFYPDWPPQDVSQVMKDEVPLLRETKREIMEALMNQVEDEKDAS